jgi:HTH-type transcriptional regulator, global nitrogen regulator NrpRI
MSFETQKDVERKILSILKVLSNCEGPAGARIIAKQLRDHGVELSERGVRYHLKLMDERGLTQLIRERDGRVVTNKGLAEINTALVNDKVGFAISRIELLSFRTSFDVESQQGLVPVNLSFFREERFKDALTIMGSAFEKGFCVSNLVATAKAGERFGDIVVPDGCMGLATVCSIVINGTLLKAGIPMDSRFGGLLQVIDYKPTRFTQVIHYDGCSLDPSEIFLRAKMTSVKKVVLSGNGEILANFREIPAVCLSTAGKVISGLQRANINGILVAGHTSEDVCEMSVELNKVGLVLLGGLNPVAAVLEEGIEAENRSMSTVIDYQRLVDFKNVYQDISRTYSLSRS